MLSSALLCSRFVYYPTCQFKSSELEAKVVKKARTVKVGPSGEQLLQTFDKGHHTPIAMCTVYIKCALGSVGSVVTVGASYTALHSDTIA